MLAGSDHKTLHISLGAQYRVGLLPFRHHIFRPQAPLGEQGAVAFGLFARRFPVDLDQPLIELGKEVARMRRAAMTMQQDTLDYGLGDLLVILGHRHADPQGLADGLAALRG